MTDKTSVFSNDFVTFKVPETRFSAFYPNSCSSGCLLKTEYHDSSDKTLYIKLSHKSKGASWGRESLNEIICYRLGVQLGFPVLQYEPCWVDLMNKEPLCFGCYSKSYLAEGDTPLTSVDLCESSFGAYQTSTSSLRKLGYSELVDMFIVWDYLIGNTDRHAANIEFLLHDDGSITPAPIFDNGKSLLDTFALYPKAWDLEHITNNFLTFQKTTNTFTSVNSCIKVNPLTAVNWGFIRQGIESVLSVGEWDLVESFIAHNYRILWEKGLIT